MQTESQSLMARTDTHVSILLGKSADLRRVVPWNRAIVARSCWKLGRVVRENESEDDMSNSRELFERSMRIRREMAPDDPRTQSELDDKDWEELMFFLHR